MAEDYSAQQIKSILDEDLDVSYLAGTYDDNVDKGAIQLFQKIFVEILNFEAVSGTFGDIAEEVVVDKWNKLAKVVDAFLIAQHSTTRVLYIKLEKLTRTAQRFAISSLVREGWARKQEFIAIFYSPDSNVWHIVCPHITGGRTILRRYIVGEGENHRTVSLNLSKMDAQQPSPLFERIDEAFRLQPVTESFYKDYKDNFNELKAYLISQGLEIRQAKKYTHLLLNRLMFLYFIQKKGWLSNNKDFVGWFREQYREVEEEDKFHSKWLHNLFFESMNQPPAEKNFSVGFPEQVCSALNNIPFLNGGLFEEHEVDKLPIEIPDSLMFQIIDNFLQQYNFTITEESPFDVDVAVDPAMLGKIYESLIAEQERGKAGIFYTPRIEVDFMCRLAIFKYLSGNHEKIEPNTLNASAIKELTSEEHRDELIEFIFTPLEEWEFNKAERFEPLLHVLKNGHIVDPACGSGAFLVGMLQVLTELYRKMSIEPNYHVKEMIVNDNLYGIDIKDWAVRMAEFRLWLNLIEGEENIPHEEPILPDFSFKIRVGDSIVQNIGGEFISLTGYKGELPEKMSAQVEDLENLKQQHFSGNKNLLPKIQNKQIEILDNYIVYEIKKYEDRKRKSQQFTLDGKISEEAKKTIEDLDKKIADLEHIKQKIHQASGEGIFLWDLAFPEVMLNGGFDIVITNPPYVRHEDIKRQDVDLEEVGEISSEKLSKMKEEYKNWLKKYTNKYWGTKLAGRSDLYVYFFFKGLELAKDTGSMVYITSNSWLDIGYGGNLQSALLKNANIEKIIGNIAKKSFERSDINTVITILSPQKNTSHSYGDTISFITLKKPFNKLNFQNIADSILSTTKLEATKQIDMENEEIYFTEKKPLRTIYVQEDAIWRMGGGSTDIQQKRIGKQTEVINLSGDYERGKWGRFLYAPILYFQLWDKNHHKFKLLEEFAEPDYGIKTGANKFFLVPRPDSSNSFYKTKMDETTGRLHLTHKATGREFFIEKEFWMRPLSDIPEQYQNQYQYKYEEDGRIFVPNLILVKNREIQTSPIEPNHLNVIHIDIDKTKNELKGTDTLEYIKFGEEPIWDDGKPLSSRTTLKNRNPWFSQPKSKEPFLLLPRTINANFEFHYNPCLFPVTDNFYYLPNIKSLEKGYLAGYMNSTVGWFMIEITARSWTNTIRLDKYEYLQLPILSKVDEQTQKKVKSKLEGMMTRNIGNIFEEFGAYSPDKFTLNSIKKDRLELDKIFFNELGISEKKEMVLFYKEMLNMVIDRLMRQPNENPSLCENIAEHNPRYDYKRNKK